MKSAKLLLFFMMALSILTESHAAAVDVVYHPKPNEKMAKLRFLGYSFPPLICRGDDGFRPPRDKSLDATDTDKTFLVPTGQRIQISTLLRVSNNYCTLKLSFVPEADRTYIANVDVKDRLCFIELLREDPSKDVGVSIEPSVGGPMCKE